MKVCDVSVNSLVNRLPNGFANSKRHANSLIHVKMEVKTGGI